MVVLLLLAGAGLLATLPHAAGAMRIGRLSLLWWYASVVAPLLAAVVTAAAIRRRRPPAESGASASAT